MTNDDLADMYATFTLTPHPMYSEAVLTASEVRAILFPPGWTLKVRALTTAEMTGRQA